MNTKRLYPAVIVALAALLALLGGSPAGADPHPGQSANVVIIGGAEFGDCMMSGPEANSMDASRGGCLPVTGPEGELGDFTFTPMLPAAVSTENLASFDTAVLNVAATAFACDTATLDATQKAAIKDFVALGKKLIIYDSECKPGVDYTWLPFPFTTQNVGGEGGKGAVSVVEENYLSSSDSANPHFIDTDWLSDWTEAPGDMNVKTTYDPHWCVDMAGTNWNNTTGPAHTYARLVSGVNEGLIIYNGLSQDRQAEGIDDTELRRIWVQELQQPFNPSGLPCTVPVVGISLAPLSAVKPVGSPHTVTALRSDLLGTPITGAELTFSIISGPNAGKTSDPTACSPEGCVTDATGQTAWTYAGTGGAGTDIIQACFTDSLGGEFCSDTVTATWLSTATSIPTASCVQGVNPSGKNIPGAQRQIDLEIKGIDWQNPDGYYQLNGRDAGDVAAPVFLTNLSGSVEFGPFPSGTVIKLVQAPGATPSSRTFGNGERAVFAFIKLDSDAYVYSVDSAGAASDKVICAVPPGPKPTPDPTPDPQACDRGCGNGCGWEYLDWHLSWDKPNWDKWKKPE